MKKHRLSNYHFIYAILDILISFGVSVITFLSFYGLNGFKENVVPDLIYSAAIAVLIFIPPNMMLLLKRRGIRYIKNVGRNIPKNICLIL